MGNKLREMFDPSPQRVIESVARIKNKMKEDKHCSFCIHSTQVPHYEMGYDAGTDTYCNMLNELRLSYPTGDQCLFWEVRKD